MSGTFEQPDDAQLNLDTPGNSLEDALGQAGVGLPEQAAPPPVYRAMPDSRITGVE